MTRNVRGVLAAVVVAPYLTALLMFGASLATNNARFDELPAVAVVGSAVLLVFGIPLLAVSALLAAAVQHAGRYAGPAAVMGGMLTGLGFMSFAFRDTLHSFQGQLAVVCGVVSGALCGLIHWRIVTRT